MISYRSLTDYELAALLKEGDHGAYSEIYDRYNRLLYIFTYKRLQDKEEVNDLIHELFLSLWVNHADLCITKQLAAYLYTCARNRILNVITHKKVCSRYVDSLQLFIDSGYNNNTDHLVRHNELLAYIEREINNLPDKMRRVFEMSRKSHMSRKDIATQLKISEETVKAQVHNALKILRIKLSSLLVLFLFFL